MNMSNNIALKDAEILREKHAIGTNLLIQGLQAHNDRIIVQRNGRDSTLLNVATHTDQSRRDSRHLQSSCYMPMLPTTDFNVLFKCGVRPQN